MPQTIINLASSSQRRSLETTAADRSSALAVSGLAEKFEGAANTSMTMPARKNVYIYIGDGRYSPRAKEGTDPFQFLVGMLLHVGANPKKSLANYPIVFLEQGSLDSFRLMCKFQTALYSPDLIPDYYDSRPALQGPKDPAFYEHENYLYVLRSVRTFHHSEFQFSADQRLYIRAHGDAGSAILEEGGKTFTMSQIARLLSQMGVPKDIRNIRLTSCCSADVWKIPYLKGFTRHTLDTYSVPWCSLERGALGDRLISQIFKAPAHHLADALWSEGYKDVTVVGYHGDRVTIKGKGVPQFSIQAGCTSREHQFGDDVRASSVSVRFRADTGPIPHDNGA